MANQNITKNMRNESAIFKYLCPSLLSEKEILEEFRTRCLKIKGFEQKSRDELIAIFIQYLMPSPQRIFPNNHCGKLINKMIQKENLSRRTAKTEETKTSLQFGFNDKKQESKQSSTQVGRGSTSSISRDRLKPPIDTTDIQSKKISLAKTHSSLSNSNLDNLVIKERSKERKSSSDSCSQSLNSTDTAVEVKKLELKRSHSSSEKTEDFSPPKKARQHIAWP